MTGSYGIKRILVLFMAALLALVFVPGAILRHRCQAGWFCCWMYCRRTLSGAPPTDPAK